MTMISRKAAPTKGPWPQVHSATHETRMKVPDYRR